MRNFKFGTLLCTLSVLFLASCGEDPVDTVATVTQIKLDKTSHTLAKGESFNLTVTFTPADAADKSLDWKSDKTDVATVDATGKVTAVAEGEAKITATSKVNSKVSATCTVKVTAAEGTPVNPDAKVTSVTLNQTTLSLEETATATLEATVVAEDGADKSLEWSSSSDKATVDQNGVVTAVAEGNATITVRSTTNPDAKAECVVTITKKTSGGGTSTEKVSTLVTTDLTVKHWRTEKNGAQLTNEAVITVDNGNLTIQKGGGVTACLFGEDVIKFEAESVTLTGAPSFIYYIQANNSNEAAGFFAQDLSNGPKTTWASGPMFENNNWLSNDAPDWRKSASNHDGTFVMEKDGNRVKVTLGSQVLVETTLDSKIPNTTISEDGLIVRLGLGCSWTGGASALFTFHNCKITRK